MSWFNDDVSLLSIDLLRLDVFGVYAKLCFDEFVGFICWLF
jgi:hypothetical protein